MLCQEPSDQQPLDNNEDSSPTPQPERIVLTEKEEEYLEWLYLNWDETGRAG